MDDNKPETNPDNTETQQMPIVVPLQQKNKPGNPNPKMKAKAETADAPDVLELPNAIQTIADKVAALMRMAEVEKIEIVGSKTYVNTAQRVYIFDTNGSLRIRSEFDITPRSTV